ncbi:hypothetical protein AVEN_228523-1 [Araneus ventricosus]|uniref:Uncharacterized protein n=1 Tax=Araneus ventricosus TaxID=182803 RepID=A0A4Y2D7T5_ARAVE|nr:hypothetical protein AVEN_228523-1 [Araneus ventricosus]
MLKKLKQILIIFHPSNPALLIHLSEFEENHQIHNIDGYVHNDTHLISSVITTPNRLICYSNTYDESSDNLRRNTSIDENTAQFPAATHIESSVHNDRAISTDPRKPKRKLFFFSLLERTPSEKESVSHKARKRIKQGFYDPLTPF